MSDDEYIISDEASVEANIEKYLEDGGNKNNLSRDKKIDKFITVDKPVVIKLEINKFNHPSGTKGHQYMTEKKRYAELLKMESSGKISELRYQPRLSLIGGGRVLFKYSPDFYYLRGGTIVFEDTKAEEINAGWQKKNMTDTRRNFRIFGYFLDDGFEFLLSRG